MINSNFKCNEGQALLEYLLIFVFLSFISINGLKLLNKSFNHMVGSLGRAVNQQLSVGVGPRDTSFLKGYDN